MTMFGNKMNPAAAATAPRTPVAPAPVRARQSRFGGIAKPTPRSDMFEPGTYRLRVIDALPSSNPHGKPNTRIRLQVVARFSETGNDAGTLGIFLAMHNSFGLAELKRFAHITAGLGPTLELRQKNAREAMRLDDEGWNQYDEIDAGYGYEGAILESTEGVDNGAPSLAGRLVDGIVTLGKEILNEDGSVKDHYRIYQWGAVPEEEQEG